MMYITMNELFECIIVSFDRKYYLKDSKHLSFKSQ